MQFKQFNHKKPLETVLLSTVLLRLVIVKRSFTCSTHGYGCTLLFWLEFITYAQQAICLRTDLALKIVLGTSAENF